MIFKSTNELFYSNERSFILFFYLSSRSETDDESPYPCVLPASLAACMRVDSCFVPTLVSMVQVLVTMPMMMVKFSNHVQHLGKGKNKKIGKL